MSLPNPNTLLPQDIVTKHKILIENYQSMTFAPNPSGGCGVVDDVIVYCTGKTAIFWKLNPQTTLDHTASLKMLLILERTIDFMTSLIHHDPRVNTPLREFTGSDGITRNMVIEINDELCSGYGGASYNGRPWCATSRYAYNFTKATYQYAKPTVHQVFFYELGRSCWDLVLDDILDWQMQNPGEYGYWTLGFNGAMTVLVPENLGLNLEYFGQNTATFRKDRLKDLDTYINNRAYTFENTWCSYLVPWNQYQSINDVMSGLLIRLYDRYGGLKFLGRMFYRLKQQPTTPNKTDRQQRANNLYKACYQAWVDLYGNVNANGITTLFRDTLRWKFVTLN